MGEAHIEEVRLQPVVAWEEHRTIPIPESCFTKSTGEARYDYEAIRKAALAEATEALNRDFEERAKLAFGSEAREAVWLDSMIKQATEKIVDKMHCDVMRRPWASHYYV